MNEVIRRRRLPHWDVPSAAYFVTVCLEGSIPAQGLLELEEFRRASRELPRPADQTESQWSVTLWKRTFARLDEWLDQKPAVRHLQRPELARLVVEAMYHFAGERYDLVAFVVMPSHYHWVFQPLDSWVESLDEAEKRTPRQRILHSLNRHSARQCNLVRGRDGAFWQRESYDHWVRDVDELERIIRYVEANPVKAGLVARPEDWEFSSAYDRLKVGLEFGEPLAGKRGGS
jgi:type I restriction enzyme R subunit